jgi:hypothetical protein
VLEALGRLDKETRAAMDLAVVLVDKPAAVEGLVL